MAEKPKEKDDNPCVAVCKFKNGYCTACKRTPKEMANWYQLPADERKAIIAALPLRPPPSQG